MLKAMILGAHQKEDIEDQLKATLMSLEGQIDKVLEELIALK